MQKMFLCAALAAAIATAGCAEAEKPVANANTAPPKTPQPAQPAQPAIPYPNVQRIDLAAAKADFDNGKAVFIDTRPAAAFEDEHVKGAINITADDFAVKADTLPKGSKIIAYCS